MLKLDEEEYAKEYQKAWDASQFATSAHYWAIEQQKKILTAAMWRCIAEADEEQTSPLPAGQFSPRRVYFHATEQERNSIRDLEIEANIYQRFQKEKLYELEYLEKNHSLAPVGWINKTQDESHKKSSSAPLYGLAYKTIVLIACFIVIANSL